MSSAPERTEKSLRVVLGLLGDAMNHGPSEPVFALIAEARDTLESALRVERDSGPPAQASKNESLLAEMRAWLADTGKKYACARDGYFHPFETGCAACIIKGALQALESPAETGAQPQEKLPLEALVSRFLGWKLPKSVCSDLCVTHSNHPHERSGTNLLTADEARQMLEHVLGRTQKSPGHPAPAASGCTEPLPPSGSEAAGAGDRS